METETTTSGMSTSESFAASGKSLIRNGLLVSDGERVSGDQYAPNLQTSGNRSTGTPALPIAPTRRPKSRADIPANVKHTCKAIIGACIDDLGRAIDSASDFFHRNNALEHLKTKLARLWEIRTQREEAFAELINMLQGILFQRNVEDFPEEHLVLLRSAFEKLHNQTEFDDAVVDAVTIDLIGGGLDAFREIE